MTRPKRPAQPLPLWLTLILLAGSLLVWLYREFAGGPPGSAPTAGDCGNQYVFGRPAYSGSERTQAVCHSAFSALVSLDKKVPLYSASRVVGRDTQGRLERTDNFRPDPNLPEGQRAEVKDYLRSGYDRGHLSPAADFKSDPQKMSESFLMSNMVPQNHQLNAGAWADLEEDARQCARQVGEVYVISGPIFTSSRPKTIGQSRVAVPDALFKIVTDGRGQSRAFVFENRPPRKTGRLLEHAVSVSSIEQQTGLNFFPQGGVDEAGRGGLCPRAFGG